jgi:hypothetical protein
LGVSGTEPGSGGPGAGAELGRRLPCGRLEESLLEAATEPATILDAHQQRCPHCAAALQTLRRRWSAVLAEAGAPVPVPAGLVERMVSRIRTALAEPGYLEVPSARGRLRIARSVVEDIARQVVGDHGLTVVGCRAQREPHGLTIEVRVVLPYGVAAAREAQRARAAVIAAVSEWAGLDVTAVDVAVVDVQLDR